MYNMLVLAYPFFRIIIFLILISIVAHCYQSINMIPYIFLRVGYKFCRLGPQNYQPLFHLFNKQPKIQTFGRYFVPENLLQIYNIVKHSRIGPSLKISILSQIQQKICTGNTDLQFNILANIYKDKSLLYIEHDKTPQAIAQIERSIQAISAMESPYNIEVASLYQIAGNLHLKIKNMPKAQKFFKDAEHVLNLAEEEILQSAQIPQQVKQKQIKNINAMMAKVFSQFCLVHLQLGHMFQSRQYLSKALQRWNTVDKRNTMAYLVTIKCKCILHSMLKQERDAIQTAERYLEKFQANHQTFGQRMWFMKFLIDRGNEKYKQQLRESIEELRKSLSQNDLTNYLIKVGVLKKEVRKNEEKETQKKDSS